MERPISDVDHRKRSANQSKAKKLQQPMKVVCITNPMKFKASASEFRALVQELTGKDSDVADNMSKYGSPVDSDSSSTTDHGDHNHQVLHKLANSAGLDPQREVQSPLEVFDAAFESFPFFLSTFADLHHDAFGNSPRFEGYGEANHCCWSAKEITKSIQVQEAAATHESCVHASLTP